MTTDHFPVGIPSSTSILLGSWSIKCRRTETRIGSRFRRQMKEATECSTLSGRTMPLPLSWLWHLPADHSPPKVRQLSFLVVTVVRLLSMFSSIYPVGTLSYPGGGLKNFWSIGICMEKSLSCDRIRLRNQKTKPEEKLRRRKPRKLR